MDVNSRDPLQNILPFRIKGTEIGRFDSSGNLKIGTTTTTAPTVRLDISGGAARVNSGAAASTALTTTGRIGVNTATPTADLDVNGMVKIGNVNIIPLYLFTTHTFTNADATGRTGPTLSAIRSAYSGVSWTQNNSSYLSMTSDNGIQLWTVPVTGIYTIRAKGAAGFIGPGLSNARGIDIQTTTTLIKGEVIKILVGQRGSWQGGWTYLGGGGGGSFVVRENSTPIIIAGGGGGTGGGNGSYANSDATRETYGMDGAENPSSGGTNGGGGKGGQGSGGGGFLQNGFAGINNNILPSSFLTGGGGGGGGAGAGGFGGGGYVQDTPAPAAGGGGGGGYSGGGGGNNYNPGGGGGSYAISTMTENGYNTDHGSVTITLTTPSVALDVNGVAVINGSSATAPALTTVGRIGVNTAAPTVDLDVLGVARLTASTATATALTTTGRIGVNTATPTVDLEVNGLVKLGNVNIVPLYVFTTHTFTNAGAAGRFGPTLTTVRNHSDYASVNWAQNNSYLSMNGDNGIQLWTVPLSGNYTIRAKGASGTSIGGKGRDIQLTTTLVKGEIIRILVGQQGSLNGTTQSSGGGGTFVVRGTDTAIIVAGGGGGKGSGALRSFTDAALSTGGNTSPNESNGGTNGGGGSSSRDGGGGGIFGNGAGSEGGLAFVNGGLGGIGWVYGGFGGGGGGADGGGGGGGYSGGGGGGADGGGGGGGGGSFGIVTLTDNGFNTGHGSVTITLTTPSVALEVIGVAVVTGSSSTATALTTTGRIGVNMAAPTVDLDVSGAARVSASSATATALTTTGRIGVNTATPTVDLDVLGAANVSTYLSVGSGGSSSGVTASNKPDAFYVRTGGSNWRDFIPLLVANSTTNRLSWGLDAQWYDVSNAAANEVAKQYSYFAGYWLNANRAVVGGTPFSVESFAGSPPTTRGIFTFTATAVSNGIVTAYSGFLSQGTFGTQQLTPQQDGIDAGVARRLFLDVSGNARVTGSMTINSCTPRSSVTYTGTVLRTNYSIPVALRGGNFITNKVYFSIRVLAGPRSLYLKPNGSATTFHSFIQQTGGGTTALSGVDDTVGFRMCEIMGSMFGSGYTVPTFTHIVGEFTIIRNTVGNTSSISIGTGITTRIYGTLVQYGNHYMQKGDFQGQALNGGSDDSYDRIDLFQFLTSDAIKDADTGNSVAVTIEG
jgi:hypothetical protein